MAIAETCPHESKVIAYDPAKRQYQTPSQCQRAFYSTLLYSRWWKTVNIGRSLHATCGNASCDYSIDILS